MPTSGRGKRPGVLGIADDASERRRLALGHSPRSAETSTEELKSALASNRAEVAGLLGDWPDRAGGVV